MAITESNDINLISALDSTSVTNDSILTGGEDTSESIDSNLWNWGFGSKANTVDQNLIIGNNQWIVGDDTTQEELASEAKADIFNKVDSIFDKLREKFPLDEADSESDDNLFSGDNPFSDGKNPFGEDEYSLPPAYEELKSSQGENFPLPSPEVVDELKSSDENPSEEAEKIVTGGNDSTKDDKTSDGKNPFAGTEKPTDGEDAVTDDGSMTEQSSFDVTSFMFGDNLSFMNGGGEGSSESDGMPTSSPSETLAKVYESITRFVADTTYPAFAMGNETPLKTSDDLLTLFRNDMFSFNSSANSFKQLVGEDSPFAGEDNPFSADGEMAELDLIKAALDGILPFNGTENVFNTPEGEIPLGNGNIDDGYDNAVIGNANRDYGNSNAVIGNGNWNWDESTQNATVGNGNWHLDFSNNNNTLGNGNWYWEDSDDNSTLGNGNWSFGDNNATIGNGNFDFGNNNTVIGNGNWVYTDNSIVIGNGNWSVVIDKSTAGTDEFIEDVNTTMALGIGVKNASDLLVDLMLGKMAGMFMPLTEDLGESAMNTYKQEFFSVDTEQMFVPV